MSLSYPYTTKYYIIKDKNLFKFPGTRLVRSNEEDTDITEANNRER